MNGKLEVLASGSEVDISDHLLLSHYSSNRAPEPFLELVRRHFRLVYGTCLRITENVHDAEEVTQECFFDLSRQACEIRTSLVGWLHQAATHRALNRVRGEKRRRVREHGASVERAVTLANGTAPSADATWSEISPVVDQALAELPEQLRTPIVMRFLEGATQADVATTLGIHQSTVSRRLSDGIECLRESLRKAGLIVPATVLTSWLAGQSAMAASPTLTSSIGKIGLAGVGTTSGVQLAGGNFAAALAGVSKAVFALLFVPLVAGIMWGEVVFLLVQAAWCCYLGLRRPEWVRVLCFTRQFPNIYEWPFFPFARWTWRTPPREWRIWMTVYFITGIEILGLFALPWEAPKRVWLLLLVTAGWNLFMGVRIGMRVRRCLALVPDVLEENDLPVDGALLLTYTLAGVVLIAKLSASPWFLTQPDNGAGLFWLNVVCAISWATVLTWGAVLVFGRYRRWREQGTVSCAISIRIDSLSPPRWLLGSVIALSFAVSFLITFVTLMHDVLPVYVQQGDNAEAVARRAMFRMTLTAMDFVVMSILPIAYLYRRIPRIAWGLACGIAGLLGLLHLGLFVRTIVVEPVLTVAPRYAPPPRMALPDGHFIVENPPNLLENDSLNSDITYMGKHLSLSVRLATGATITLANADHETRVTIPKLADSSETQVGVTVMLTPHEFQKGIPRQIQVSLVLIAMHDRTSRLEQFVLPLPANIDPAGWKSQFKLSELPREKAFPLGEIVTLGTVQQKPVTLNVAAAPVGEP